MYTTRNFKSKKELQDAIQQGQIVGVFHPGVGGTPPADGVVSVEGPQHKAHTWYAQVTLKAGRIVKVK